MNNTVKGNSQIIFESENIVLENFVNDSNKVYQYGQILKAGIVHFYFAISGNSSFIFSPHYSRELGEKNTYFFYQPDDETTFQLHLSPKGKLASLTVSLMSLHKLFVQEDLPFLKPENKNRKYYEEKKIDTSILAVLKQILSDKKTPPPAPLYYHGKILELIALYFRKANNTFENCPFLKHEEGVRKLKFSREYLLKNIQNPPGIKQLSRLAGLNESQLKAGFKEYYGNTVHGYLTNHRMEQARILLDKNNWQVKEIALEVGYGNTSHFITAFKKKFGITPKQYILKRNQS